MNVQRSLWLALPLALLLPVGCNDGSGAADGQATEPAAAAPAAETPAAAEHGHRHGHHARRQAAMMIHAARDLDLTDAQKATVDQLSQQLHGQRGEARGEHQAMHTALVEGVRAGNVDMSRLAPLQAAADQRQKAHAAREAAALDGLWAALQPAQRQALVASVRERQANRQARWEGKRAEGETGGWQKQRLAHLTSQLGLDATQEQQVSALLGKGDRPAPGAMQARHQDQKARTEAMLMAFAGASFQASKLDLAPAAEGRMGRGQHNAQFLAQLVPILRADQREKLAASMVKERE